ncbi:MAG: hypothetical protein Ct9H300mP12_02600 [Acidimicrobiales bacterium]|nr:MAG: hypothetical protein Ct9H300mP12_02600 [Acidimicrobiales bacterium]
MLSVPGGATVVELPVIAIVDSADEGAALIAAVERAVDGGYDWIVVTSPNGGPRVVDDLGVGRSPVGLRCRSEDRGALFEHRAVVDLVLPGP